MDSVPHPRKEPRFPGPLTPENIQKIFQDCADFRSRSVILHGDLERSVHLCWIEGMVRGERMNDYVLRPLAQDPMLASLPLHEVYKIMAQGALYTGGVQMRTSLDEGAADLVAGCCLVFFPGQERALSLSVATEEKRSVGEPENEPALKGARDSFVESIRTNTSLVRRRLRAPELRVKEHIVGRQSLTPVDVVYLEGIADAHTIQLIEARLDEIDIDGIEATGNLEEYLVDRLNTPFPLLPFTQRPDRFCSGLLEGRVGILADGLPLGYLAPGTLDQFFKTGQDKAFHWMVASALNLIRYFCALVTLLLPGLYIAMVTFHPEAIPPKLAVSIVAAKQQVPFSTIFEVLIMLLSFEVLQEAGLRLPGPIGSTVSILGGLVVGNAAVEAHIVSPAVLIAVAIAGVAGYTQPSQDFAGALRLWRVLLGVPASLGGPFGVALGGAPLPWDLGGAEGF